MCVCERERERVREKEREKERQRDFTKVVGKIRRLLIFYIQRERSAYFRPVAKADCNVGKVLR